MKDLTFLKKLKAEKKIELIEPSEELALSYNLKSKECREVSKLTFDAEYYETTVTQSYYSMYNSVLSLFFKCGIKCENHSGSCILLYYVFCLEKLYYQFKKAKEERIDKQYYVTPKQNVPIVKESAKELILIAEKFVLELDVIKNELKLLEIKQIREKFIKILST